MRRTALLLFTAAILVFAVQPVMAQECIELDVELEDEASSEYGGIITGYVEIVNCGDEANEFWLEAVITVFGQDITLGPVPVTLGAGEVISREIILPAPPILAGETVELCLTAYPDESGSSEPLATDCGTVVIPDMGGVAVKSGSFGLALSGAAGECVDVDLEFPDTVYAGPASFLEGSFELTNCGDEATSITMDVALDFFDTSMTVGGIPVELGAGETIAREFRFPAPPALPSGEYTICVTATAGEAMATSCQTIVVVGFSPTVGQAGDATSAALSNYPNPFNPATTISFHLERAGGYTVTVYNIAGQEVWEQSGTAAAGEVNLELDASDFSNGVYFYRLTTDDVVSTKKMLLLK